MRTQTKKCNTAGVVLVALLVSRFAPLLAELGSDWNWFASGQDANRKPKSSSFHFIPCYTATDHQHHQHHHHQNSKTNTNKGTMVILLILITLIIMVIEITVTILLPLFDALADSPQDPQDMVRTGLPCHAEDVVGQRKHQSCAAAIAASLGPWGRKICTKIPHSFARPVKKNLCATFTRILKVSHGITVKLQSTLVALGCTSSQCLVCKTFESCWLKPNQPLFLRKITLITTSAPRGWLLRYTCTMMFECGYQRGPINLCRKCL